jgi:hypothetical protein
MKMDLKRLEPCAGKLARTVFRRVVAGNSHGLSDNLPQVDRLLDLTHSSRLEQLEKAIGVLGKRLDVVIQ